MEFYNFDPKYTGKLIKKLREANGMSQVEVANILHVTKSAISQWENGEVKGIKVEYLYKLGKLLGISTEELLHEEKKQNSLYEYWKTKYDLSIHDFGEIINNKNINEVKSFYDCKIAIREKFVALLKKWANDHLNNYEKEEFQYIKERYFRFDESYCYSIINKNCYDINKEKKFIKEVFSRYKDKKILLWELSKIYDENDIYSSKDKIVLESENVLAIKYLFSSLSQVKKDKYLQNKLPYEMDKKINIEAVEKNEIVKIMLNEGSNCIGIFNSVYDIKEDVFLHCEGKKVRIGLNEKENRKYKVVDISNVFKNWKKYSLDEYYDMVDNKMTKYLKNVVNDKDKNPLKYYEYLLNNEGGDSMSKNHNGVSNHTHTQQQINHYANQHNRNNSSYVANHNNHSNQLNPNNNAYNGKNSNNK